MISLKSSLAVPSLMVGAMSLRHARASIQCHSPSIATKRELFSCLLTDILVLTL
jgi:hypothetical protein